jgi:hypothetical protein
MQRRYQLFSVINNKLIPRYFRNLYPLDKCILPKTNGTLSVGYSFQPPSQPDWIQRNSIQDFDVTGSELLSADEISLFEIAVKHFNALLNVNLFRDDKNPTLHVVRTHIKPAKFGEAITLGFADRQCQFDPTTNQNFVTRVIIGLNALWPTDECELTSKLQTFMHELGHAILNFAHPFRKMVGIPDSELTTSHATMNYAVDRNENLLRVTATTLMPNDLLAAEQTVGLNQNTTRGDTVHYLSHYLNQPEPIQKCKTIATISDSSGTNTLSTQGIPADVDVVVNLHRGPWALSQADGSSVVLSHQSQFHHVHAQRGDGIGKTQIILNEQNNVVDFHGTKGEVSITTAPSESGNDVIFGFDHNKDKLVFDMAHEKGSADWKVEATPDGTIIHFDEKNSLKLAGVKPEKITADCMEFKTDLAAKKPATQPEKMTTPSESSSKTESQAGEIRIPQTEQNSIWNIFANFPPEFLNEFKSAFFSGMIFSFISGLTEDFLKRSNCTEQQIAIVSKVMQSLLILASGSIAESAASYMASSLLSYFNFTNAQCNLAGMVASNIVKVGLSPWKIAGSVAGTLVGGCVGLWAEKKLRLCPTRLNQRLCNEHSSDIAITIRS